MKAIVAVVTVQVLLPIVLGIGTPEIIKKIQTKTMIVCIVNRVDALNSLSVPSETVTTAAVVDVDVEDSVDSVDSVVLSAVDSVDSVVDALGVVLDVLNSLFIQ